MDSTRAGGNFYSWVSEPRALFDKLSRQVEKADVRRNYSARFDVDSGGLEIENAEIVKPGVAHAVTLNATTGKVSFADVEPEEALRSEG